MKTEPAYCVSARCVDAIPVPGSVRIPCYVCGAPTWRSPATGLLVAGHGGVVRQVCERCVMPIVAADPDPEVVAMSPGQAAEAAEYLRDPPERRN